SFCTVKKNKKKGTATLRVKVDVPGSLELAGKGLKKVTEHVARRAPESTVKLSVKAKGKTKQKLNKKGKVKGNAAVTFTPSGGTPNRKSEGMELVKKG